MLKAGVGLSLGPLKDVRAALLHAYYEDYEDSFECEDYEVSDNSGEAGKSQDV